MKENIEEEIEIGGNTIWMIETMTCRDRPKHIDLPPLRCCISLKIARQDAGEPFTRKQITLVHTLFNNMKRWFL